MKLIFTCAATLFLITNYCLASAVDFIDKENKLRCGIFNTKPNSANKVQISTSSIDKDEALSKHTMTINGVLNDQSRVSKVHATNEQRKKILQAVMGSVIIHGDYPEYTLARHKLSETDEFYKHFEILRLTQELSAWFLMMKQADAALNITRDIKSYDSYDYNNSYQNLYTYSGLNKSTLCDWFEEMYAAHGNGIILRRDTSQTEKSRDPRELSQCAHRVSQFFDRHTDEPFRIISDDRKTTEEQNQEFIRFLMSHGEELRPSSMSETTQGMASNIPTRHTTDTSSHTSILEQLIAADIQRQINTISKQRGNLFVNGFTLIGSNGTPAISVPPIVESKGGDWIETFELKGGGTVTRQPTTLIIKKGNFQSTGKSANVSNLNMNGTNISFHISTDMTRDEFIAALKRDGNL